VEIRFQDGTKRKVVVLVQKGVGKDIKRVKAKILGYGSSSRIKKPKV